MSRLVDRMENDRSPNIASLKQSFLRPSMEGNGSRRDISLPRIEVNGLSESNARNSSNNVPTSPLSPPGERERKHTHHRKYREGNPDYTSATTGKFTDCMFDLGGETDHEATPISNIKNESKDE